MESVKPNSEHFYTMIGRKFPQRLSRTLMRAQSKSLGFCAAICGYECGDFGYALSALFQNQKKRSLLNCLIYLSPLIVIEKTKAAIGDKLIKNSKFRVKLGTNSEASAGKNLHPKMIVKNASIAQNCISQWAQNSFNLKFIKSTKSLLHSYLSWGKLGV